MGAALRGGQREGQNILGDGGAAPDVGVLPDTAVLVHGAERADAGVVLYRDVAGQFLAVGQDTVVADGAVVTDDQGVGHDEAVAAYPGGAAAALCSAGDGDIFADGVVTPFSSAVASPRYLRSWGATTDGKEVDPIPSPKARLAIQDNMGDEFAVLAQLDVRTDGAIGTYIPN